jgi:hypothetical protein
MPTDSPNRELLDEVKAAGLWFRAKKTRPIWARRLDEPQRVRTLEGDEEVPAGAYLCRGEAGDVWPQTAERLLSKYVAVHETTTDGWQKYEPRPDSAGVWAARIGHPFEVQAAWGRLQGKPGDYLVKDFSDGDQPYPADVWIVDAKLFAATYEAA